MTIRISRGVLMAKVANIGEGVWGRLRKLQVLVQAAQLDHVPHELILTILNPPGGVIWSLQAINMTMGYLLSQDVGIPKTSLVNLTLCRAKLSSAKNTDISSVDASNKEDNTTGIVTLLADRLNSICRDKPSRAATEP